MTLFHYPALRAARAALAKAREAYRRAPHGQRTRYRRALVAAMASLLATERM